METTIDGVVYESKPEPALYECMGCALRHKESECLLTNRIYNCPREHIIWEIKQNMGITPQHYKDTKLMDLLIEKNVGFAEGNIIKYVYRWKQKNGIEDLHKAKTYLDALIAYEELNRAG